MIQDLSGTLYGTTDRGGAGDLGTIFSMAADGGGFTTLHDFTGDATDGARPLASLIQGTDGMLYGTTSEGGASSAGTIFQIAPDGSGFNVIHSFSGGSADGRTPSGPLIQGPDGTLYGTATSGGLADLGIVFGIAPDGSGFTILHSFAGDPDGARPVAALNQASDGILFGTTVHGGGLESRGTVFRMAPDGSVFGILHSFMGGVTDGAYPYTGLIQGPDGTLYGTTRGGGSADLGIVFEIAPDGSGFTVLHEFVGNPTDGDSPRARLIQGLDGTLYGTTVSGGTDRVAGTVFQMDPDGRGYTILHIFTVDPSDGAVPVAGLLIGIDGNLYGTTAFGGMNDSGVVFKVGAIAP
jgi:uncharacterized repeat protein (TIGR03803 family)